MTERKALVMGLGLFGGGVGATRHLVRQGYRVTVTDLRSATELAESVEAIKDLDVELRLGEHRIEDFQQAQLVVKNPAVKPDNQYIAAAIEAGAEISSEILLFLKACKGQVIGITGSNGKTTTAHMTYAMVKPFAESQGVKAWLGGNMGRSLLDDLDQIGENDLVVMELSSFQLMDLDRAKISPTFAAIVNVTPNHLDWHKDMAEYLRAKSAIFRHQEGVVRLCVLNADDPISSKLAPSVDSWMMRYSVEGNDAELTLEGDEVKLGDEVVFTRKELRLPGTHNLSNALCAAALAIGAGASHEQIQEGLRNFAGVEHRLEHVRDFREVGYFNDSIATTPESTIAALKSFDCPIYLLLGGSDKGLSFDALAEVIATHKGMRVIYVTGPVAPRIADAIHKACAANPDPTRYLKVESISDFDEAVKRTRKVAAPGAVFLMSPACASFYEYKPGEKFRNFEHRGQYFKELVMELA